MKDDLKKSVENEICRAIHWKLLRAVAGLARRYRRIDGSGGEWSAVKRVSAEEAKN